MEASAALPRCYVASPLGFTEAGSYYFNGEYLRRLREVVEPVDPWKLTTPQEVEDARARGEEREMALEIGRRNAEAIRTCTLLAAHLDGQEVDSGTAAEIGFAYALGKWIAGLRTDVRQTGENEAAVVNLQVRHFIDASGGTLVTNLDDLEAVVEAWASERGTG